MGNLQRTKFFSQKPKVSGDSGKSLEKLCFSKIPKSFAFRELCFPRVETLEKLCFSTREIRKRETASFHSSKGISPLIAAVLLIAFTMAIAGIMATWATSFSQQRLATAEQKADCIGGIDLRAATFSNTTLSAQIINLKTNFNMTGLVANVVYSDPEKSKLHKNIRLKDYNVTDPLSPGFSDWFIYNTNDTTKPLRLEAYATNCGPDFTVRLVVS